MGGQRIVFGQDANQIYHTFRYIDAFGLHGNEVMEAIRTTFEAYLPLLFPPLRNAPLIGYVRVSGVWLEYHAYPVSKDLVNVGSIARPKARPGA